LTNITYAESTTTEQRAALEGVVTMNPEVMHGIPCFAGTRVPVQTLLDFLEAGDTLDKFLQAFPRVRREQAIQFLEMAKNQLIIAACEC
jgi:uncharacterized protein (DUF433 family)